MSSSARQVRVCVKLSQTSLNLKSLSRLTSHQDQVDEFESVSSPARQPPQIKAVGFCCFIITIRLSLHHSNPNQAAFCTVQQCRHHASPMALWPRATSEARPEASSRDLLHPKVWARGSCSAALLLQMLRGCDVFPPFIGSFRRVVRVSRD